jgi:3-methyl-2-oxobutanoate hydroxymethyltransferase
MMRTPASLKEAKRRGEKIAALTAYDYPMGRLLDECGVDVILVGDSLGMVVLGYPDTTRVTVEDIVHHTRAVVRGVQRALVVADLPARSYETPADAVENGRRLVDAGAHAVKLEGGTDKCPQIEALAAAGIPIMGHIGMLPQHVIEEGGYKVKGRSEAEVEALLEDGRAVARAGAFAVVLEIVAAPAARLITGALDIPTIGIGSGDGCDGQILVTHDLIGLFPWFRPKFVKARAEVAGAIREAVGVYVRDTKSDAAGSQ